MPSSQSFTLTHTGRVNALVCECAVAEAFDPTDAAAASAARFHALRAIWDTGATNTCISQNAATQIGMVATGQVQVAHAGGINGRANTYLVNIGLPNGVGFPGVRVTECQLTGADMLIGMDIIGAGDFAVTNKDGKTVMTYRFPSSKVIDFVIEHGVDATREKQRALIKHHPSLKHKARKKTGRGKRR